MSEGVSEVSGTNKQTSEWQSVFLAVLDHSALYFCRVPYSRYLFSKQNLACGYFHHVQLPLDDVQIFLSHLIVFVLTLLENGGIVQIALSAHNAIHFRFLRTGYPIEEHNE